MNGGTCRCKHCARLARCGISCFGARAKPRPEISVHQYCISGAGMTWQIQPGCEAWRIRIAP